jgi:hypothetical protein
MVERDFEGSDEGVVVEGFKDAIRGIANVNDDVKKSEKEDIEDNVLPGYKLRSDVNYDSDYMTSYNVNNVDVTTQSTIDANYNGVSKLVKYSCAFICTISVAVVMACLFVWYVFHNDVSSYEHGDFVKDYVVTYLKQFLSDSNLGTLFCDSSKKSITPYAIPLEPYNSIITVQRCNERVVYVSYIPRSYNIVVHLIAFEVMCALVVMVKRLDL